MFRLKQFSTVVRSSLSRATLRTQLYRPFSTSKGKEYETTIGLEVHAQIISNSKLFSGASTIPLAAPNTQVARTDMALPGALPILNEECVNQAIRLGIALNGNINQVSRFDRKHYFYCDMPQGYQITQQLMPIVSGGYLDIFPITNQSSNETETIRVRIDRIQLEQDSGKNIHDLHPEKSFVDLNRAGVGLVEIVGFPDIHSAEEARSFLLGLQNLLVHLNISTGAMEAGAMRCDVNVSVKEKGSDVLGERVEIKNLSSLRAIVRAIEYESKRQAELYDAGENVLRETRGFDVTTGKTVLLRSKEQMLDYRFFPEPDLPPLRVSDAMLKHIKETMPELPEVIRSRFENEYKLSSYDANVLLTAPNAVEFFENILKYSKDNTSVKRDPKICANWFTSELFGRLRQADLTLSNSPISVEQMADLIDAVSTGTISGAIGKKLLDELMINSKQNVEDIIVKNDWKMMSSDDDLNRLCEEIISKHQKEVQEYKETKNKRKVAFLISQALKVSKGKANPKLVAAKLHDLVEK